MHDEAPPIFAPDEAPLLQLFDRWLGRLENGFALLAAAFIFGLMLLGMTQVLGRQLFNTPMVGYIDFVELSMASFAFLAIAYCQRTGGHVRMDLFVNLFRGRPHWIIEAFGIAISMFMVAVLIWFSWDHFMRAWTSGDSTIDAELPVWPSKLVVPVAFGLLFMRLALQLAGYMRLSKNPEAAQLAVPRKMTIEDIAAQEIEDSKA